MRTMFAVILLVPLSLTGRATAQTFEEWSICTAIGKPGLFYVRTWPTFTFAPVNGARLVYDRDAKFVLITAAANATRDPDYEGVWHVRTQTVAEQSMRANKAHVYRPPVQTRCSNGILPDYPPGDRMVPLTEYLDHHLSEPNDPRPKKYDLSRRFHLTIRDVENNNRCIITDDRDEYDVRSVYGFTDVSRRDLDGSFEAATTLTRRAYASKVSFHGLSSQFAYRSSPAGACVTISAPIPTGPVPRSGLFSNVYQDAVEAAATWKPLSTLLVVKRLEGKRVIGVTSTTVRWARE